MDCLSWWFVVIVDAECDGDEPMEEGSRPVGDGRDEDSVLFVERGEVWRVGDWRGPNDNPPLGTPIPIIFIEPSKLFMPIANPPIPIDPIEFKPPFKAPEGDNE
jgi:hypothetical protein